MEMSAPKRRKTSPTTSVPIDESNGPASSDSATRRSSRLNPPSYASTTNVSLTRSNPNILAPYASSRGSQPSEVLSAPAASQPSSPTSNHGSVNDLVAAQLEDESETGGRQKDDGVGNPNATVGRPISPVRRAGGGLSLRPGRTPNKPSPRPLPPPSAEEEELIDPFKGRRLRRSPPPGVLPEVEAVEPELPPTPTQKGLSDPSSVITSPIGIHNTPSKRPRRSRILAAKMHSSPLKLPPLRLPEPDEGMAEEAVPSRLAKDPLRNKPRRKRRKHQPHSARQIEEADLLVAKKALRDSLLAEVAQLKDDLKVASHENKRLYHVQGSRRRIADLPDAKEQSRLLDVLRRHALPPEKEATPGLRQDWLEAVMNPIAFLPFGEAHAGTPVSSMLPGAGKAEEMDPLSPGSHHPVSISADEELPYLQVFTPLLFTSTITAIQPEVETGQEPVLQRHAISVASSPPGLFVATIDMTVNTKTLSIAELVVPRLDPSAIGELGPFLEEVLRGGGNSALTRNVGVVTWAMGEWVRKATRRARFWHAVTSELGNAKQLFQCAKAMRQKTRRKRDRGQYDEDGEEYTDGGPDKAHPSKADVVSLMGRTCLDLDLSGVAGNDDNEALIARIQWRVEFDWTGEARNKIGLLLRAPVRWHASDDKGSLAWLPDMFDKLLRDQKDPLEAVKTIVSLMIADGQP